MVLRVKNEHDNGKKNCLDKLEMVSIMRPMTLGFREIYSDMELGGFDNGIEWNLSRFDC